MIEGYLHLWTPPYYEGFSTWGTTIWNKTCLQKTCGGPIVEPEMDTNSLGFNRDELNYTSVDKRETLCHQQ